MKNVKNIAGDVLSVDDSTPCHAGVNGDLPIMLDSTVDAKLISESLEREKAFNSQVEVDKRKNARAISNRMLEYGSSATQLEFMVENGIEALITRNLSIKQKHRLV